MRGELQGDTVHISVKKNVCVLGVGFSIDELCLQSDFLQRERSHNEARLSEDDFQTD